jgi:hypothetical protein
MAHAHGMMLVTLAVLLGLVLACSEREPPNEGQVQALATSLLQKEGLAWGPVTAVWPPGEPDAQGRRWWQVEYREYRERREPVVLVDAESGWARFAEPGERVRRRLSPQRSRAVDRPSEPGGPDHGGTWILIVRQLETGEAAAAGEIAERLNRLATATALRPLFSIRSTTLGGVQVVYGWDGSGGIQRDEVVEGYLRRWGEDPALRWEDLSLQP